MGAIADRIKQLNQQAEDIIEIMQSYQEISGDRITQPTDKDKRRIIAWLEQIGYERLTQLMTIASQRVKSTGQIWLYFCKSAWNELKENENPNF